MTNENLKQLRRSDFTPVGYTGIDVGKLDGLTAASRKEAEFIISERRRLLNIAIRKKLNASFVTLSAIPEATRRYNANQRYPVAIAWGDFISGRIFDTNEDGEKVDYALRPVPQEQGNINWSPDVVFYNGKYYEYIETGTTESRNAKDHFTGENPATSNKFQEFRGIYANPVVNFNGRLYTPIKTVEPIAGGNKAPENLSSEYWDEYQDLREFFGFENPSYVFTLINEYGEESRASPPSDNILTDIGDYIQLNFLPSVANAPSTYAGELKFRYPLDTIWQVATGETSDRMKVKRVGKFSNNINSGNLAGDTTDAEFGANIGSTADGYKYWANVNLEAEHKTSGGDIYLYEPSAVITSASSFPTAANDGKWVRANKVNIPNAYDGSNADGLDFVSRVGDAYTVRHISALLNYDEYAPRRTINNIPDSWYGTTFSGKDYLKGLPLIYASAATTTRIAAGGEAGDYVNLPYDPDLRRNSLWLLNANVLPYSTLAELKANATEQIYWRLPEPETRDGILFYEPTEEERLLVIRVPVGGTITTNDGVHTFTNPFNYPIYIPHPNDFPVLYGNTLYHFSTYFRFFRPAVKILSKIINSQVITATSYEPSEDIEGRVNSLEVAETISVLYNNVVYTLSGTAAEKVAAYQNLLAGVDDSHITRQTSRAGIGEYLRIYRSSTRQKRYVLVGQVPTNQHFFKDYTPSGYETELPFLETEDYLEPPEGITNHIFTSTGRYLVCATNRVYISPVGVTHAFIREIVFPCQEVLGFIDTGSAVVVLTDDRPFVLQLQSNEQGRFTPYRSSVDTPFPCVSAESIVDMGQFGLYASHEGLIAVGSGKLENVTQSIFTERQWRSMDPTKLRGVRFNDFYLGKFEDKAFLFNPNGSPPYFTFVDNFDTPSYNILDGNIYVGKQDKEIKTYSLVEHNPPSNPINWTEEQSYSQQNVSKIDIPELQGGQVVFVAIPVSKFDNARALDSEGNYINIRHINGIPDPTINEEVYRVGIISPRPSAGTLTILDEADKKLYAFARGEAAGGEWTSPVIMNDNYHSIKVKYGQTDADPDRNEKVTITIYDENGTQIGDPCETTSGEQTELPMLEALDKDDVVQRKFYFTISKISEELHSIELMGDKDNPLPFVQFSTGMSLAAPPARTPAQYLKNFIPLRGVVKGVDTFDLPNPDGTTGEKQIVGDKANADDIFFNPINQKWYYLPGSFPRLSNTNKDPYSRLYFVGEQTEADSTDPIKRLYYIDMYKLKQAEDDTPQGHSIASIQISAEETPDRCVCVHYNQVGGKTPDPFSVGGWVGFVSPNARTILDNDNTTQLNVYRYNSRNEILDAANLVDSGGGGADSE